MVDLHIGCIKFTILMVMYKLWVYVTKAYWEDIERKLAITSGPLTRQVTKLYIPFYKSQIAHNRITLMGVKLWNDVSSKINIYGSYHVFKATIKIYNL